MKIAWGSLEVWDFMSGGGNEFPSTEKLIFVSVIQKKYFLLWA